MFDGYRIKRTMDRMGVSQSELAVRTGISQPTISRTIAGERTPKVAELNSIAAELSTPLSYFLLQEGLPTGTRVAARASDDAQMVELMDSVAVFVDVDRYLADFGF